MNGVDPTSEMKELLNLLDDYMEELNSPIEEILEVVHMMLRYDTYQPRAIHKIIKPIQSGNESPIEKYMLGQNSPSEEDGKDESPQPELSYCSSATSSISEVTPQGLSVISHNSKRQLFGTIFIRKASQIIDKWSFRMRSVVHNKHDIENRFSLP